MEGPKQADEDYTFFLIELLEPDDSRWVRCDDSFEGSGSLRMHAMVKDQLVNNPIQSLLDEEQLNNADFELDRFIARDGLAYLEFDRRYRKVGRNSNKKVSTVRVDHFCEDLLSLNLADDA